MIAIFQESNNDNTYARQNGKSDSPAIGLDVNAVVHSAEEQGVENTKSKPQRPAQLVIRNHHTGEDRTLSSPQENAIMTLLQFPTF